MKSFIICFMAMFITVAGFSQKAKGNPDTTTKSYLTYTCTMHPTYVSNVQGKCPLCNNTMTLSKKEQMKAEVVKLYTCPMHPEVVCTKDGKCPKCDMDLAELKPQNKVSKE